MLLVLSHTHDSRIEELTMDADFTVSTRIDAPRRRVWEVLSDIGSIYRWNPGVKASRATSEAPGGENATRHCDLQRSGGKSVGYLEERAVDWREGEGYKILITESNLPLKTAAVSFELADEGDGTRVIVGPRYELKGGVLGSVVDRLVGRRQYRKGMQQLLAGLKHYIETGEQVGDSVPG